MQKQTRLFSVDSVKLYDFFSQADNHKEYASRKTKLTSMPVIENIELTAQCNLNCLMCIPAPLRKQKYMTFPQLKFIVEKNINLLKGEYIWLHHYGEPLMHPDLFEMISYLVQKGINPRLSTNCTMLSSKISRKLIKSGLKEIVFSVDNGNEKDYNYLRKGADYNKTLNNVREFLKIKEEMDFQTPITQVQYLDINHNEKEIAEFIYKWSKTTVNWINIKKPTTRINCISDCNILKKINSSSMAKRNEHPCFWFWSSFVILCDGDVVVCCNDLKGSNIIGNAFNDDLTDLWNSKKIKKIRKEQINGKFSLSPVCENCPEIKSYNISFKDKLREETNNSRQGPISFGSHNLIRNYHRQEK